MGTGITSILLHEFPYNAQWLRYISYICFGLNVLLFTIFLALTVIRYVVYPEIWCVMIAHPAQSLFLGCFPMAFASEFFFFFSLFLLIFGFEFILDAKPARLTERQPSST